jgi:hypothetical protein
MACATRISRRFEFCDYQLIIMVPSHFIIAKPTTHIGFSREYVVGMLVNELFKLFLIHTVFTKPKSPE